MPSETTNETPSIQIANQIINVANTRMKEGMLPDDIAQGLRHAAANFSAFVESRKGDKKAGGYFAKLHALSVFLNFSQLAITGYILICFL